MKTIISLCLIIGLMIASWSVAFATDHDVRFERYQNEIKNRDSGVYEIEDDLYVHVRLPLKGDQNAVRVRCKAMFQAKDLLYQWMSDYILAKRDSSKWRAQGLAYSVRVLDELNPPWMFQDWNISLGGQEFTGMSNGHIWLGQCMKKEEIIKQIPPAFYEEPNKEKVFANLKAVLPVMLERDCGKTLALCSVIDLVATGDFSEEVQSEAQKANAQIKDFLERSVCGSKMRLQVEKISNLKEENFSKSTVKNQEASEVWDLYGRCMDLKDEPIASLVCFKCAVVLDKTNEDALVDLAMAYSKLGYDNLAYGYATLVVGIAKKDCSLQRAKEILSLIRVK